MATIPEVEEEKVDIQVGDFKVRLHELITGNGTRGLSIYVDGKRHGYISNLVVWD